MNNTKVFSVTTEKQTWVPLTLFANYKIIRTVVNGIGLHSFSSEVTDIFCPSWIKFGVYRQIFA
jgi:hypothetical protein